jgi:hypothetical protein
MAWLKSIGCVSNELKVYGYSGKVRLWKPLRRGSHDFQLAGNYTGYSQGF